MAHEHTRLVPAHIHHIVEDDLPEGQADLDPEERMGWKGWCGEKLEDVVTHRVVLGLIALDAVFVLTDLGYTFLEPSECKAGKVVSPEPPEWLETLSQISLAITTLFLIEIPLEGWCFGLKWWNPFGVVPHAGLHLFDAVVIILSFVFEVFLKGKERELASLLIVFRLWRLVKLVGGVAVGVGEWDEDSAKRLVEAEKKVKLLEKELSIYKAQLGGDGLVVNGQYVHGGAVKRATGGASAEDYA